MLLFRGTIFAICAFFWLSCVTCNAVSGVRSLIPGLKSHISPAPIIGSLAGFLASAAIPLAYHLPAWLCLTLILLPEILWLWPIPIVVTGLCIKQLKRR
jgi:hypothetical protein